MLNKVGNYKTRGFTLFEVILALAISGIFLSFCLTLIVNQWRGSRELKQHLEVHYAAATAGRIVSDAICTAQTVQWVQPAVLRILPWPDTGVFTTDLYYIDDKDHDGIKDLYWQHLNVPSPLASYITTWECTEVETGLWKIHIQANLREEQATWETIVRRRT